MTIDPHVPLQRTAKTLSAPVADDFVALHVDRGTCFGMADVSAEVWTMLEQPTSLETIVSTLTADYDVSEQQCREEVGDLIALMVQEGLVESAQ